MKRYLEATSLKEVDGTLTSSEMVKMVHDDFKQIVKEMNEAVLIAQELGDEATADLLISTIANLEKHAWMLDFHQQ